MNSYSVRILQMLSDQGRLGVQDIQRQLNISRRMILYYQKQINSFLKESGVPPCIIKDDILFMNSINANVVEQLLGEMNLADYVLDAKERRECIILKIGLSKSALTLENLIERFDVSRSTLLGDVAEIKSEIKTYGINLYNNKRQRYYFEGDEYTVRYCLMNAYHSRGNVCIDKYKKNIILEEYFDGQNRPEDKCPLKNIEDILIKSETFHKQHSIYFAVSDLAETILLILLRGQIREADFPDENVEDDFPEVFEYILKGFELLGFAVTEQEKEYLKLVLQSAKVSSNTYSEQKEIVEELAHSIVKAFENASGVTLSPDNELFEMFRLHVRSMYYRTKYRIKTTNFQDDLEIETGFYYITKKVMEKIASAYSLLIDEGEICFINYYLMSMTDEKKYSGKRTKGKIVVVCASGIGSSLYIKYQLKKILEDTFSIVIADFRKLREVLDEDTQLIITTIDLENQGISGRKVMKVSNILTREDKRGLIDWLLCNEMYIESNDTISNLFGIIDKYTVIRDQEQLFRRLNKYFRLENKDKKQIDLREMICPEHISIYRYADSWEDGVSRAAFPLIKEGIIKEDYVRSVIDTLREYGPYCEFLKGILIAHAEPVEYIQRPVLSLAVFREAIEVEVWKKKIHAVFVLVVRDKISHADALSELVNNLLCDTRYQELNCYGSAKEIYHIILGK